MIRPGHDSTIPIRVDQDGDVLGNERFIRRVFGANRATGEAGEPAAGQPPDEGASSSSADAAAGPGQPGGCKFTFEKSVHRTFLEVNQSFLIAKRINEEDHEIAIRIRSGSGGRSEWLNELQVYMIPNFGHTNILDYLGSDKTSLNNNNNNNININRPMSRDLPTIRDIRDRDYLLDSCDEQRARKARGLLSSGLRLRLQYWLMNRFEGCVVLRDYLREHVLTWPQMIGIARGVIDGLHYLHENAEFTGVDRERAIRGFIESTNGALKMVAFVDKKSKISMHPHHTCTVVHRNLSSLSIVLKGPELTACIWNFGHSKIHHPFQPTNNVNLIDEKLKEFFMASPYSPPEVLQGRGHMTLTAMKSIDMYACGILFWELLSRCSLPKLTVASELEHYERSEPSPYFEPYQEDFGPYASTGLLSYVVCRLQARPKLKPVWLVGNKTYSFSQTIQDLWDQDFDARVHTSTVMDRLKRTSLADVDTRNNFRARNSKFFDPAEHWPPKIESPQVPIFNDKLVPNLVFLD